MSCHETIYCRFRYELAELPQYDLLQDYQTAMSSLSGCAPLLPVWAEKPVNVYIIISAKEGCVKREH